MLITAQCSDRNENTCPSLAIILTTIFLQINCELILYTEMIPPLLKVKPNERFCRMKVSPSHHGLK